ncbi:hypothetical protein P0M11_09020 [Kaistella sp. PBT33-4]|uniref:hypothetical protein n=1 Tax=Kaistella sp. PBT33-4 TaxID=3032000 RepID=UPI0023D85FF2|nr:hypothetical protein [Kaistella sp. PBT33-4]MDF0720139.1 hypothetical protein [Kaistella sp. PBT33-4]
MTKKSASRVKRNIMMYRLYFFNLFLTNLNIIAYITNAINIIEYKSKSKVSLSNDLKNIKNIDITNRKGKIADMKYKDISFR